MYEFPLIFDAGKIVFTGKEMIFLYYLVITGFIAGNLASIASGTGVRGSFLDVAVAVFVTAFFLFSKFRFHALTRYVRLFGPFVLTGLVSLIFKLNNFSLIEIGIAALYLLRFVVYSLVTVAVGFSSGIKKQASIGLWIGGVMIALLGLFQYFLYPNLRNLAYLGWDPHEFRVFSTLLDPNFTGIILVLTLGLSSYIYHKKYLRYKVIILASGLTLLALLLTYSRGSYIALISSLLVWGIRRRKWIQILLITVLLFSTVFILPKPEGEGVDLTRTISIYSRLRDSEEARAIFTKFPILGVGFDTLRFYRGQTQTTVGTEDVSHSGAGFHNSWLFILATTGIAGLIAYLWIWKEMFRTWSMPKLLEKELLLISVIAVFVESLFDNSLFYPQVMVWMWIVVGNSIKENTSPSAQV